MPRYHYYAVQITYGMPHEICRRDAMPRHTRLKQPRSQSPRRYRLRRRRMPPDQHNKMKARKEFQLRLQRVSRHDVADVLAAPREEKSNVHA